MESSRRTTEAVFRDHAAFVLATLIRRLGDFDLAEDALQDAFTRALERWPDSGVPTNPAGWLIKTGYHKAIDRLRRDSNFRSKQNEIRLHLPDQMEPEVSDDDDMLPDDRLKLVFTACHPALAREARVALTLRTVGGLSTKAIANAFLVPEKTMAQRLVRAKRKIRLAGIPYQVPEPHRLAERLEGVLSVIYLIFNEGYLASEGPELHRSALSLEALRLARLVCELLPKEPEAWGLLAMMLLHDSRREARISAEGELITLEEQDRSRWNHAQIREGIAALEVASALGASGPYQIQAAIATLHARARRPEETDWGGIVTLYDGLLTLTDSPIVSLNRAAAVGMHSGAEAGLAELARLDEEPTLIHHHLFHAARADFHRRARRSLEAEAAYVEALRYVVNPREKAFLKRRLASCRGTITPDSL